MDLRLAQTRGFALKFLAPNSLENSMKAIRVHQFGGPEVLKLEEIPTPKPYAGQVLVRVLAIVVNPYDTYMRAGTYAIKPPRRIPPAPEAADTVEAVVP